MNNYLNSKHYFYTPHLAPRTPHPVPLTPHLAPDH